MLGEQALDLYRCTSAPIVAGVVVPVWTKLSITASVQPASRSLQWLPEGERQNVKWRLWTRDVVCMPREVGGQMLLSDRISVYGELGEVIGVADWHYQTQGLFHYEIAVSLPSPEFSETEPAGFEEAP